MKLRIILALSLLCASTMTAQERYPTNPKISAMLPDMPKDYLTDMAGVVKNPNKINDRLDYIRDSLQLSLVAVTMKSIGDYSPADVAREIGRKWKVATADSIGSSLRNTGGVILLVIESRDCRVEVAIGSEGYLTDGRAATLCRNAIPYFRRGDFDGGILSIANGFAKYHTQEIERASRPPAPPLVIDWGKAFWIILIAFILIVVIVILWMRHASKVEAIRQAEYEKREAEYARRMVEMEKQRKEAAERERIRWESLTPEQQAAELAERARIAEEERLRRKKEAEEYEERRKRESYYNPPTDYGSRYGGSSGGGFDSGWSLGGSGGFMGGGGGSKW